MDWQVCVIKMLRTGPEHTDTQTFKRTDGHIDSKVKTERTEIMPSDIQTEHWRTNTFKYIYIIE